jgi:hypothetical protein
MEPRCTCPYEKSGLGSQGQTISETLTIPATSAGSYATARDYLVVTSITSATAFSAPLTVGTNAVGSTQWVLPSHYVAAFGVGCSVSVPSGTVCSVECTRDVPYAIPQIYQPGYTIVPPICDAFPWPTLNGINTESFGDIDSAVTGIRLTVQSGAGRVTLRMDPIGLRT